MTKPVLALTGATGFLGSHLIGAFVEAGWDVRALTRRPPPDNHTSVFWVRGDLFSSEALETLIDGADVVVHAAGAIKALSKQEFFEVNEGGTDRIATLAAASNQRFVLVSSLAAREAHLSPYAASKAAGEAAAQARVAESNLAILRPPAVYGPGDPETLKLFKMAERGVIPTPPSADARAGLVHAGDVAAAAVIAASGEAHGTFDIHDGTAEGYSWEEIADAMARAIGRPVGRLRTPMLGLWAAGAAGSVKAALFRKPEVVTLNKVPELLHENWGGEPLKLPGYAPKWSLAAGFQDAVNWYRSQNLLKSFA